MPPRSVTKWLEIATAQKLRPLWANEFKDVLVRAKVNDIVAARDRDSFSEPWRRVLLKKVSKTTWLLLDENGKALDDCPCSGFTEKSLLEEAGMDYYDFPFDDVPPCATSPPSATNDDKDEDDASIMATEALLNCLAHRRGFGLAEARSEIMRRRTNMQSLSQRLQKTKGVDVCGLKRCGRFRGGRSSRGYESPVCHTSSRCRLSAT